jgi:hypothetical protein
MKSTKPSPFDWRAKGPSLFTKSEQSNMNALAVTKKTERKEMKIYSKAGAK